MGTGGKEMERKEKKTQRRSPLLPDTRESVTSYILKFVVASLVGLPPRYELWWLTSQQTA